MSRNKPSDLRRAVVLVIVFLLMLQAASIASANVKLASIFGDHMLLQRNQPIRLWGQASPNEKVTATIADASVEVTADDEGRWEAMLPAMSAGGPHVIEVAATNHIKIADVLIGDLWVCSGQSNMAYVLAASSNSKPDIAAAELPNIRLMTVPRNASYVPADEVGAKWVRCDPSTAPTFSAVGFYFGRMLHTELDVPIGLINASWGGTRVEPWTPPSGFIADDRLKSLAGVADVAGKNDAATRIPLVERAKQSKKLLTDHLADSKAMATLASPDFDDADWKTMTLPAQWEQAGLKDYNGLVWFRKVIDIPGAWAGKPLTLIPGAIDEIDITYFNGEPVGKSGSFVPLDRRQWNQARKYEVPGKLVVAGPNVIAMAVIDTEGAGGLWQTKAEGMYLLSSTDIAPPISIAGEWQYKAVIGLETMPRVKAIHGLPSTLYNGMINPLIHMPIAGAIWYQGESNVSDGDGLYAAKMKALIVGWRKNWDQPDLPVYLTQIAPYRYGADKLPKLWEAQAEAATLSHVDIAHTLDLGNMRDIHPKAKRPVGERLARLALVDTYGRDDILPAGPRATLVTKPDTSHIQITFAYAGQSLRTRDDASPDSFEIAGEDGLFVPAVATIEGNQVRLSSEEVPTPIHARFAWDEGANPNLVNSDDLPAYPFRMSVEGP